MSNDDRPKAYFDIDLANFQPRQLSLVNLWDAVACKFLLYGGALGGGKLLSDSAHLLTPFGWKSGKDIKIGDVICNPDGSHQNIIQIKPRVTLPAYHLTFHDGSKITVPGDHLWQAWRSGRTQKKENNRMHGQDGIKIVETKTLCEWLDKAKQIELSDSGQSPWPLIPVCEEQHFNVTLRYKSWLPPYLLGVLLGDGCITNRNPSITCHKDDLYNLECEFQKTNLEYSLDRKDNKVALRFIGETRKDIVEELTRLKLMGTKSDTKFIPREFLFGSIESRYALLQGLMDTDGTISDGRVSYCSTSETLSEDIRHLIRSLGGIATMTDKKPWYYDDNRERVYCKDAYNLYIKHREPDKLFRLLRKKEKARLKRETPMCLRLVNYEIKGKVTGRCITVDNPNGLYITDDFIVTHNSYLLRWFAIRFLMKVFLEKGLQWVVCMIACEDYPSLKDRQLQKISREFPDYLGRNYVDHRDYGRCYILAPEYGNGVIVFRNLDDPAKYACYSEDTDIRGKGFVPVSDIKVGEECFSLNPENWKMEWKGIEKVHEYDYDGEMLEHFSRFGASYCVTPNHKMLYHTRRKPELIFSNAEDLPGTYFVPRVGKWESEDELFGLMVFNSDGNNGKRIELEFDDYLKFLGLYLAEGSTDTSRWKIGISQHNGKNHEEISQLLNKMGVTWHYDKTGYSFNNKSLVSHLRGMGGKSNIKYIPQNIKDLPVHSLQHLFDGLMLGDGHHAKEGKYIYVTNSPKLCDDVMEISLKLGYVPTVYTYPEKYKVYPNGKTYLQKEYYHITLTKRVVSTRCDYKPTRKQYYGKVYCPTVPPYHNILIRHRGRVMFCGQSSEFAAILVDELTKNTYDTFTFLRTRLRWPGLLDLECPFLGATNPGSIGHGWVKALWMDGIFGDEWIPEPGQVDYRELFKYIPSKADDNKYLDHTYWQMLNTLPESIRKAFRDGDWNVFVGQAFMEWNPAIHICEPFEIPPDAPIIMTYDWGFGAPFSIGWWWVDSDDRIYRFDEWYGWNGTPNSGLSMADSDVAKGIIARERNGGFWGRVKLRLSGRDSFAKRPDTRGGGYGPATAEEFRKVGALPENLITRTVNGVKQPGENQMRLTPADPDRLAKIKQCHERLRYTPGERPMVQIYNTCRQFIRTIPNLVIDKNNIEDVDNKSEDHHYDEWAQICMARPLRLLKAPIPEAQVMPKDISHVAQLELEEIKKSFDQEDEFYD